MKFGLVLLLALSICSCTNTKDSKSGSASSKNLTKSPKLSASPEHLYVKNDSLYMTVGKKIFCIKYDTAIDYKKSNTTIDYKHPFDGIYQIDNDSIKKSYSLVFNKYLYFTTYEDVGMGYRAFLYVFDTVKKILIKDPEFKRNYLYSSAGIIIIDKKENKIFCVDKPDWYEEKRTSIVSAAMYSVVGRDFRFYKNIYEKGDDIEADSSITNFYNNSLADNGKRGLILPKNWWKAGY